KSMAGSAQVIDSGKVQVTGHDGTKSTPEAENVAIASGSVPVELGIAPIDDNLIVDSSRALACDYSPKNLGIIGAGIIGVELGSVWSRLGAEVTLLEALDDFMPAADREVAKEAQKTFKKQGLAIELGAKVTAAKANKKSVKVEYSQAGEDKTATFDKLVVAVGRRPNTADLFAKSGLVELDDRGFIKTDDGFRTSLNNVYAVGDVAC